MNDVNQVALENELVAALCVSDNSPLISRAKLFFGLDCLGAETDQKREGQSTLRPGSDYLFKSTDRKALASLLEHLKVTLSDQMKSSLSEEFASVKIWRVIIAGLPGGGKTRGADALNARLIEEQIQRLDMDVERLPGDFRCVFPRKTFSPRGYHPPLLKACKRLIPRISHIHFFARHTGAVITFSLSTTSGYGRNPANA